MKKSLTLIAWCCLVSVWGGHCYAQSTWIHPQEYVITAGESALFVCFDATGTSNERHWFLDDEPLTNLHKLANSSITTSSSDIVGVGFLKLDSTHQSLNNSRIACQAILEDGLISTRSNPSTIRLQGRLNAPGELRAVLRQKIQFTNVPTGLTEGQAGDTAATNNSVDLSWNNPFTLDLIGFDPDLWSEVQENGMPLEGWESGDKRIETSLTHPVVFKNTCTSSTYTVIPWNRAEAGVSAKLVVNIPGADSFVPPTLQESGEYSFCWPLPLKNTRELTLTLNNGSVEEVWTLANLTTNGNVTVFASQLLKGIEFYNMTLSYEINDTSTDCDVFNTLNERRCEPVIVTTLPGTDEATDAIETNTAKTPSVRAKIQDEL